jgi:pimeloyl-ACP methyl ester carboxylesterase
MSFFKHKNFDIKYVVDGDLKSDKEIVILLNGIMMSTLSWEIFKEALSENNTLIRYDMVDQGESSKSDTNYTQDLQVEVLNSLINELKLTKVNLVGISYGASVALKYSIKYPKTVKKLILANGVAKTSSWLKAIGDGWNQVSESRNGLAYYNISIPYIYSPKFYSENIEWMEERKKILVPLFSNPIFLDSMVRLTKSAETHDATKSLHLITANTLIISSEYDFLTPPFEQKYLNENIKGSKLIHLPNAGHASMYEEPELFTTLILGFINTRNIPKII